MLDLHHLIYSFRLLSELYSLLSQGQRVIPGGQPQFPSPLGVIFSLMFAEGEDEDTPEFRVSVSSRSYILSYYLLNPTNVEGVSVKFPSPLGVIFSLII